MTQEKRCQDAIADCMENRRHQLTQCSELMECLRQRPMKFAVGMLVKNKNEEFYTGVITSWDLTYKNPCSDPFERVQDFAKGVVRLDQPCYTVCGENNRASFYSAEGDLFYTKQKLYGQFSNLTHVVLKMTWNWLPAHQARSIAAIILVPWISIDSMAVGT